MDISNVNQLYVSMLYFIFQLDKGKKITNWLQSAPLPHLTMNLVVKYSLFLLLSYHCVLDKKLLQFMFFCPKSTYFHPVYGHSSESLIPSPSYYFQKIVSDIFTLNKKWAPELQNPFPTRSWIAWHGPIVFFSTGLFNRFLWKLPFSRLSFPVNICIRYLFNLVISPRVGCNIFSKM